MNLGERHNAQIKECLCIHNVLLVTQDIGDKNGHVQLKRNNAMANNSQVRTTPLLRQFAVALSDGMIEITTKLGPQTLSRATFATVEYPPHKEDREPFLQALAIKANPQFSMILKDQMTLCIADQAQAVENILAH